MEYLKIRSKSGDEFRLLLSDGSSQSCLTVSFPDALSVSLAPGWKLVGSLVGSFTIIVPDGQTSTEGKYLVYFSKNKNTIAFVEAQRSELPNSTSISGSSFSATFNGKSAMITDLLSPDDGNSTSPSVNRTSNDDNKATSTVKSNSYNGKETDANFGSLNRLHLGCSEPLVAKLNCYGYDDVTLSLLGKLILMLDGYEVSTNISVKDAFALWTKQISRAVTPKSEGEALDVINSSDRLRLTYYSTLTASPIEVATKYLQSQARRLLMTASKVSDVKLEDEATPVAIASIVDGLKHQLRSIEVDSDDDDE